MKRLGPWAVKLVLLKHMFMLQVKQSNVGIFFFCRFINIGLQPIPQTNSSPFVLYWADATFYLVYFWEREREGERERVADDKPMWVLIEVPCAKDYCWMFKLQDRMSFFSEILTFRLEILFPYLRLSLGIITLCTKDTFQVENRKHQ